MAPSTDNNNTNLTFEPMPDNRADAGLGDKPDPDNGNTDPTFHPVPDLWADDGLGEEERQDEEEEGVAGEQLDSPPSPRSAASFLCLPVEEEDESEAEAEGSWPTTSPAPSPEVPKAPDSHMVVLAAKCLGPDGKPLSCHPSVLDAHKEDVPPVENYSHNPYQSENPMYATPTAAAASGEFPSAASTRERVDRQHQELLGLGGCIEPVGSASAMDGFRTPEQQLHPASAAAFEQPPLGSASAQSAAQNAVYPHDPSRVLFPDTNPQGQWHTYAQPGPYPGDHGGCPYQPGMYHGQSWQYAGAGEWGHYPQNHYMQSMMHPNQPCQGPMTPPTGLPDQQCGVPPPPPPPNHQPSPPPSESESPSSSQTRQSPSRQATAKITVQFKYGRRTKYLFDQKLPAGTHVIVEGDQGVDFGEVVESRKMRRKELPGNHPWVKRRATHEEVSLRWGPLVAAENTAVPKAQMILDQCGIPMRVVGAEYQFDRKKLTFHYVSPWADVRFREALPACHAEWRCRIWFNKAA